ncbi:MAG: magnesium transporter [Acidimicrobiales bacterium]|nr:magnesium transporter [Acidimicrobiales bacterium]
MIAVRHYENGNVRELDPAQISRLVDDPNLLWVDVVSPSEDDLKTLQDEFSLHPLAMEDVRERHQRPKLEKYPTHTFLVAYSAGLQEVDVFIGPTWVITVRESDTEGQHWSLDAAKARFDRTHPEECDVGFLVYVILDEIVDGYFDATDHAEEKLEVLEDRIFGEELQDERVVQEELFDIRRGLLKFRRAVVPLREVVSALLRKEVEWVDDHDVVLLQDVYDHVLRAIDLLDGQRELMGNAVDAHLAIISNRMNSVMKKMTSYGAILLGSTLIAGIYGMNFHYMPELRWHYGYLYALGLMLTITVVGIWYFGKKDWL